MKILATDKLIPYARNPRTHSDAQVSQIAASIKEFGFLVPVVVGEDNGIIAGHGRVLAAQRMGLESVPTVDASYLTDAQRRAFVIADNKLTLNADWDEELLKIEMTDLRDMDFDLDLTGFSEQEFSKLFEPLKGKTEPDDVPEVQKEAVSKPGDVWLLGPHRVVCGDAAKVEDVELLMAGEKADMVFTDPPYNVDYEGYTGDRLKIGNDSMKIEEYADFLAGAFGCVSRFMKPEASIYVCHASAYQREVQTTLESAGFEVRTQIIWAKNTFGWGFGRYKFQHEPIFYGHIKGRSDAWYGDKSQSTLWEEKKPSASREHPTMKPVELMQRAIMNSTKENQQVLDPFGGSGSTLIACERLSRVCRTMEIDPNYCDVIVQRWQDFTGKKAVHESGEGFWRVP